MVNVRAERRRGLSHRRGSVFSSCAHLDAKHLLRAGRTHRTSDNSLPWVVDIAFREDERRLRNDHSAHNVAIVRCIARSLLTQDASARAGVSRIDASEQAGDQNDLRRIISPLFT